MKCPSRAESSLTKVHYRSWKYRLNMNLYLRAGVHAAKFILLTTAAKSVTAFSAHNGQLMQIRNSRATIYRNMSLEPSGDDEIERYNDDAFGLVFLAGGLISQDVIFASTFLSFSAIAALSTYAGIVKTDARIPGIVAVTTLVFSPVFTSLISEEPLGINGAPPPIEIALCMISFLVSIFNWRRDQN